MNLYEIDTQIENLIDEETGEIADLEAFYNLQMERESKIENLCLRYKNLKAEAEALKAEEKKLHERRDITEAQADRMKNYVMSLLGGEKLKTARATVSYRKSSSVVCNENFVSWAEENNRDDLLNYSEPKPVLAEIKKAIQAGEKIPAEIIENQSMSIK